MKGSRSKILVWIGIILVIVMVSAGCGQERREEKYETQINMEETSESWHGISRSGNGNTGEIEEYSKANGIGKPKIVVQLEESERSKEDSKTDETKKMENGTYTDEYWTAEASAITYPDVESEKPKSERESSGDESTPEEHEIVRSQPYYLTETDKNEVITRLVMVGESYGLTYYPDVTESETWDSPTPIYEEELILGRKYVMDTMVEYTEGAFALMQMEGCSGFALSIKEKPSTVTGAYYEVYVYWM